MTSVYINGKKVSKEELSNYELTIDSETKRALSFRKREKPQEVTEKRA